jgi:hypothetical protein
MAVHRFDLFADYNQFYVWDAGANPDAPTDYTDDDVRRRVKAAPHVVVIQPMRNMTVPVELEVCAVDPGYEASRWDHIAECSLFLPTGKLQVHECTGGAVLDLAVPPGSYRLRAHFGGLGLLSEDGLEGEDHYLVVLWPQAEAPLRILKQWEGDVVAG